MHNPTPLPKPSHTAPLKPTKSFLRRLLNAVGNGLDHVRKRRNLRFAELAFGFHASHVQPVIIQADDVGLTARLCESSFSALLSDSSWTLLPDPFDQDEPIAVAALRAGDSFAQPIELDDAEALHLSTSLHTTSIDHLCAILCDPPEEWSPHSNNTSPTPSDQQRNERTSKAWIYDILAHLPGLTGVDHTAALLLPDQLASPNPSSQPHYVLVAEQLFTTPNHSNPLHEHLIGLLIPCYEGRGGLLETALQQHHLNPSTPYHLFLPSSDEDPNSPWLLLSNTDTTTPLPRFHVRAHRDSERMMVLIPLPLPDSPPAFLSLNFRNPSPIALTTATLFGRIAEQLSDALTHSDLFRISPQRMKVFHAFAHIPSPTKTRADLLHHLSPALHKTLNSTTLSIGLLDNSNPLSPTLHFHNPQGWDLDQPHSIPLQTTDSLAALSLRIQRPIVLSGGRPVIPNTPTLRWNNSLVVHEPTQRLEDTRLHPNDTHTASHGWRPLCDYYKPTSSNPIYAGLAIPLQHNQKTLGVLAMDFDRSAPWHTYSGIASQTLYQHLANLIASQLSLLPS